MAVEDRKTVVLAVEHCQTLPGISYSYATPLVDRGSIAQSRSIIYYAHLQHCSTRPCLNAYGAPLLACRHRVFQGILHERLQQQAGHKRLEGWAINGVLDTQALTETQAFRSEV